MPESLNRRSFLKSVGAAGASLPLAASAAAAWRPRSSWEKLNIAGVGVDGKGKGDIRDTAKGHNVVALCDVDQRFLDAAKQTYPGAKLYRDWRKMLEQDDIDAVTVSTPDHLHCAVAMAAMALGKHVYVQKPLTHSVFEARQLLAMAKKSGVVTQMGNQHRSNKHMKGARKLVRDGMIGAVREAHVWTDRPIWPQGIERPAGSDPVPGHLDWDLWLGPAPSRPFKSGAYHRFRWRGFWDFGTGALGDMGCHLMDPVVYSLDLYGDCRVSAEGPPPHDDSAPKWSIVRYEFPAIERRPAVALTWYDGGKQPPRERMQTPEGVELPKNGALFVGEKASLFVSHKEGPWVFTDDWFADVRVHGVESTDHYQGWTNACRGEGTAISSFETAAPLTEIVLLGNVAYRLGKRIEWNSRELRVENAPEAAALIRRDYRDGWDVDWL